MNFDGMSPQQAAAEAAEEIRIWWAGRIEAANFDLDYLADKIASACQYFYERGKADQRDEILPMVTNIQADLQEMLAAQRARLEVKDGADS